MQKIAYVLNKLLKLQRKIYKYIWIIKTTKSQMIFNNIEGHFKMNFNLSSMEQISGSFILLKGSNTILHKVTSPYRLKYIYRYQSLKDSQFILRLFHLQGKATIGAALLSSFL